MSPAEEGVSDAAVAISSKAGAAVSKKGRKRRKTAVADGSITADEMLRRKRQAELRVSGYIKNHLSVLFSSTSLTNKHHGLSLASVTRIEHHSA